MAPTDTAAGEDGEDFASPVLRRQETPKRASGEPPARAGAGFDPGLLGKGKPWSPLVEATLRFHRLPLAILRALFRVLHIPFTRWYLVFRYDDVREVLQHDREFPVPWSQKMRDVTDDRNFVLGMPRDAAYERSYRHLAEAFTFDDIERHVTRASAEIANMIVEEARAAGGPFDAVGGLITAVPARLCRTYYGLAIAPESEALFAQWTLAISSYIFGPFDDARRTRNAMAASEGLRDTITRSIQDAQQGKFRGVVMQRLTELQARPRQRPEDPQLDTESLRAYFYGMVLGFIPTDVLAGGNMLEMLLRRPDFLERARAAALADDDELLWKCLREALRFRHINLGPWRECAHGYTLGPGSASAYEIPPDARVLALAQSAMFDARRVPRPGVYDPGRGEEDYFTFGVGQHWCIGAYIAKAQITQTFKPLLKCDHLRAARIRPWIRVKRYNDLFPLSLDVELTP